MNFNSIQKVIFTTIIFLLLNCSLSYSQTNTFQYIPKNKDSIITYINSISEKKIAKLGEKNKKEIKKLINERKTDFINKINDSSFVFDINISKCINTIKDEIYKSNKNIDPKDFYFFIDKSPIPNAACYGNGIFTLNIGLFNIVENEDELAFIICHELAHFILEHNDKSLLKYLENINSKETKNKVKEVKNTTYGKLKLYGSLMKDLKYNFLNRSRKAEVQADSLGLRIFNNTKYDKYASISSLQKLEHIDEIAFNEDTKIRSHFNFENYPFKDSWLKKDEALFDIKESANDYALDKDSLKSHPDIPLRIDILQKYISNKINRDTADTNEFIKIKRLAAANSIAISLDDFALDFALYQVLVLFNKKEIDEIKYCNLMGFILMKTYESKKNHTFGKFVGIVNAFSEEKYLNETRSFLHNIELKNIRKIGNEFCLKYKMKMKDDLEFKKITEYFNNLNQI